MSELSGTRYRDAARPAAISATKLLGQVMFLVPIALAFAAIVISLGSIVNSSSLNVFSGR